MTISVSGTNKSIDRTLDAYLDLAHTMTGAFCGEKQTIRQLQALEKKQTDEISEGYKMQAAAIVFVMLLQFSTGVGSAMMNNPTLATAPDFRQDANGAQDVLQWIGSKLTDRTVVKEMTDTIHKVSQPTYSLIDIFARSVISRMEREKQYLQQEIQDRQQKASSFSSLALNADQATTSLKQTKAQH